MELFEWFNAHPNILIQFPFIGVLAILLFILVRFVFPFMDKVLDRMDKSLESVEKIGKERDRLLHEKIDNVTSENDRLRRDLAEEKKQREKLELLLNEERDKREALEKRITSASSERINLKQQLDALKDTIQNYEAMLAIKEQRIKELELAVEEYKAKLEDSKPKETLRDKPDEPNE